MMTDLNTFQALWSDMDEALIGYRSQAIELRDSVSDPELTDSVSDLHERLVATRRSQDRLERILATVGLFRSRVRKLVADLDSTYEDAWRDAMNRTRIGEYTSAKERDATYATASVQELINLRRGKRMQADVEEVYEYVNTLFRGLDSSRRDTDTRIRLINLESQLEH